MDSQTVFTTALSLLTGCLIVAVIIGWRMSSEWLKVQKTGQLAFWANSFVQMAENTMQNVSGKEKLDFVLAELEKMFPKLNTEIIRSVVETSHREMESKAIPSKSVQPASKVK